MESQEESFSTSNAQGAMPSHISNDPPASAQPSDDVRHAIQGQITGSTSTHTGRPISSVPLTYPAISIDPTDPNRIRDRTIGTDTPPRDVPVSIHLHRKPLETDQADYFVGKGVKSKAHIRSSARSMATGASKAGKIHLAHDIVDRRSNSQKRLDNRSRGDPEEYLLEGTLWESWEGKIPAEDERRAHAAAQRESSVKMPALNEKFLKIRSGTTCDERTIVSRKALVVPARYYNWDTHNFGKDYPNPLVPQKTMAEILEFWRVNFGTRRMCLTTDLRGPHMTYENLLLFSTAQVARPNSSDAGYLNGDILENVTAALLGESAFVVPTSTTKLYFDGSRESNSSAVPAIELKYKRIVIFVNSGDDAGAHWHVVVISVDMNKWWIRDSSHNDERREKTVTEIVPLLHHYWGDIKFDLVPGYGPQQSDGYNCGIFAIDNAVDLVRENPDAPLPGNKRRYMMLSRILYRAQTYSELQWHGNAAARVFPPTPLADFPENLDINLTKETLDDPSSTNGHSTKSVNVEGDTLSDHPTKTWAEDFEEQFEDEESLHDFDMVDESQDQSQVGGVDLVQGDAMEGRGRSSRRQIVAV